jgi:hypothetical protein
MAYTTIKNPGLYFNTVLYTGNNSSPRTITGVGFQPDMNWSKIRSESNDHWVSDAVRGANKIIRPNGNDDELVSGSGGYISSFNNDGYVIAAGSGNNNNFNKSSGTMVSFNWKANGAGSANTAGSINSTVSVNTTSGFSIVSYTGNANSTATVGHGLGVAPSMILFKRRSTNSNWFVYHKSVGAGKSLKLNAADAESSNTISFGNTTPTSTVFTVGDDGGDYGTNYPNGGTFVAYCFAEKTGYSKFGTFVGNGTAYPNSPFIYLGFKPSFFMWKNISEGGGDDNWNMVNAEAQQYNIQDAGYMQANNASGENGFGANEINFLSNGVKIDKASSYHNQNGSTYIYMAFAEQPLVGDNPATAR